MALTVETGVFPAYVVDHLTGKTYQVGAPLLDHGLDAHTDVDMTTVPPYDGQTLVWDSTAVDVNGNVGQWVPSVATRHAWIYSASATGGVDPGPGNVTAGIDVNAIWTFEISAQDVRRLTHNLLIMRTRDNIVLTDMPPGGGAATFFQRFELTEAPVDHTGWYTVRAKLIEEPGSTQQPIPLTGSEISIDFGFGGTGVEGPQGPTGPTGISTVIIGSYGTGTGTPTTLPPDGALPAGWAAPGSPAYQMEIGQSLIYEAPTGAADPLNGGMYQWVSVSIDPAGWVLLGEIVGPVGPEGPTGPQGIEGPTGPPGPPLPLGGAVNTLLVKASAADQDAMWGGVVEMTPGASLRFPAEVGRKITFYSGAAGDFAIGIASGRTEYAVPDPTNKHSFLVGGVEEVFIDKDGFGPRGTYAISWQNGFSGSCNIRVNPASVTLAMWEVECNVSIANDKQVYMFAWPAGVPAPPQELRIPVNFRNSSWACTTIGGLILANAGGCNLHTHNQNFLGNDHKIDVSFTWTR